MFEFRFYAVASGRMASEIALVHDMAAAGAPDVPGGPPGDNEPLWQRYGVPGPLGSWIAHSGRQMPGFLYIIKWDSLAQRDANFPRFWTDPFWRARRAQLTDGMSLVDSIETWLMDPLPAWERLAEPAGGPVGGVHELRLLTVVNGAQAEAASALEQTDLPALMAQGARILGLWDVVIGPNRPQFVLMLAWPDADAQAKGWAAVDADPAIIARRATETERHGRPAYGIVDSWLMEPMPFNMPAANLGQTFGGAK